MCIFGKLIFRHCIILVYIFLGFKKEKPQPRIVNIFGMAVDYKIITTFITVKSQERYCSEE